MDPHDPHEVFIQPEQTSEVSNLNLVRLEHLRSRQGCLKSIRSDSYQMEQWRSHFRPIHEFWLNKLLEQLFIRRAGRFLWLIP